MKTYKVILNSIDKVKQFETAISNFDGTAELRHDDYSINAKSILAIFSMNLAQPLDLTLEGEALPANLTCFLA